LGIQLELNSLESATLFYRLSKAQFDMYYLIGIGSNQLPDVFQFVYHSRYQDARFNESIAKLRATNDPAQMRPLLDQIASILAKREYCANNEVDNLAREAAATESPVARKLVYLRVASLLTDRGGQNRMRYCNPQLDAWIVDAEREDDPTKKLDLYHKIQRTAAEDLPQIYLWYPANVLVARTRVGNIQLDPSGSWFFITKLTLEGK
jgi:ABC-type transport system substrate-binding protein